MPKIKYESRKFSADRLEIIEHAVRIIDQYTDAGYSLTLRQLYYQFISRDIFPDTWKDPQTGSTNNERSYKRLGDIISQARMAGLIDWEAIEDRTRNVVRQPSWDSPEDIISACANQYQIDLWENQDNYVEVWVEKDAMEGVVEKAAKPLRVPYFSCRGFSSMTAMWEAAMRIIGQTKNGKSATIYHLGDHDPSGIDMTRDIEDRLHTFRAQVIVERIALNMDQVEEFALPPNPVKLTDKRSTKYVDKFGEECWELDALQPQFVVDLITDNVRSQMNKEQWKEDVAREKEQRGNIKSVAINWDNIVDEYGE